MKLSPSISVLAVVISGVFSSSCGREAQNETTSKPVTKQSTPELSESGFVYTADERGNSVSVIDLSTGKVQTVALRVAPHNVQISRDGSLLFIVGMVGDDMSGDHSQMSANTEMKRGRLLIFDTATMDAASSIVIEVGHTPAHVIVDGQGKFAYVTNGKDNTVSVVDLAQKKVVAEVPTGAKPHGLRMSPDGREIYLANTGDDSVSVIDVAQAKVVARIPVGKAPAQVAFTPDGSRAYVTSTVDNTVTAIDTAERKSIATVAVGRKPIQVFATPDGHSIYAANEGSAENPDNTASVIDVATNKVVATVVTGKGAHGVVLSDDGMRAFIANSVDGTVSIVDTATHKVIRTFKVGDGSGGITFRRAGR
jgi:YVTN family beta-propeller protein